MSDHEHKDSQYAGNQSESREGFGDDAGTRVGRPDEASARKAPLGGGDKVAGPSTGTSDHGLEGSILDGADTRRGTDEDGPAQKSAKDAARGGTDGGSAR